MEVEAVRPRGRREESLVRSRRGMQGLRLLGKFLISVGVGVLLFIVWTLWGTGLYTAREQSRLEEELATSIAQADVREEEGDGPTWPRGFAPPPGEPVFRMVVPKIGLKTVVVEGVGTEDLKKGPGHYPTCRPGFERPLCTEFEAVWPGEEGRVVLSGHRTTYGAEFHRVDELEKGDEILIQSPYGQFVYSVTHKEVVEPDSRAIVLPGDRAEIVLTTCEPKFSAEKRLIVYAALEPAD